MTQNPLERQYIAPVHHEVTGESVAEDMGTLALGKVHAGSIDRYKWGNIRGRKQKVNEDYLEALSRVFPQYFYWIMTGEMIPEAGQISPEIEKARKENSLKTG